MIAAIICLLMLPMPASTPSLAATEISSPVKDSVWYDSSTGDLVPVEVADQQSDARNRGSRWQQSAKTKPAATTTTGGNWNFSLAELFGWLMLVVLLVGLVSLLAYVFANSDFEFGQRTIEQTLLTGRELDQQTRQRIEHLPEALRDTSVNPRGEAERLMNVGQYNEAIIYLYGHQLLLLDRVHWLRLTRGKTNNKYIRETRQAHRPSGEKIQQTVRAFERSYFGRHAPTQAEFMALWQNNLTLEQDVQMAASTKSRSAASVQGTGAA